MRHVGNDSDAFVFIRVTRREQSVIPLACDPPDQIDRREEANVGKPSEKDLCQFVLAELQLSQASAVDKGAGTAALTASQLAPSNAGSLTGSM